MMKKIVSVIAILIVLMGAMYMTHNYNRKGCEIVQKCDGELTFEDSSGFIWYWYADTQAEWELYKSLSIGDCATLKMYDNGTVNNIEDDVITKIVLD